MIKNLPLFLLIPGLCFLLIGCPDSKKQTLVSPINPPPEEPEDLTDPARERHFSITSTITGIEYPLHIYLPADYETSGESYPVIYATDGQWIFRGFSQIIDHENKSLILVAIEQGPNDRRAIDYRLPGLHTYFDFLTAELLPQIENDFRIDGSNRTLLGTSYGGILAGLAPLIDDIENPWFKNYLSFDPSFWVNQNGTMSLEQERYNASNNLNATLLLTSATGTQGNDYYVSWYMDLLQQRNYNGLRILRYSYSVHHNDVANPSFATALNLLF